MVTEKRVLETLLESFCQKAEFFLLNDRKSQENMFFFENYFTSKCFCGYAENEFDNNVKIHVSKGRKLSAQDPKLGKKYNSLKKLSS